MATEKRLIDVDRRKRVLERFYEHMVEFGNVEAAKATRAIINGLKIEPIVDAVPVVRCKDCKHWMYEYDDVGLCVTDVPDIEGVQRLACDFCSYGERRTDERKAD